MKSKHTVAVAVVVNGLTKTYGGITAVKDLTFTVGRGEVSILGLVAKRDRQRLFQRVGVQFQDSAWQPAIRVGEICETTAVLYEPVPDWREMVVRADLDKRINTPVESLSGASGKSSRFYWRASTAPNSFFSTSSPPGWTQLLGGAV